jgi:hypothetical protein
MNNITNKKNAIELRRQGRSYKEINKLLNIPKSTLSDWFSKISWSNEIKEKLIKNSASIHTERLVKMNKARISKLNENYDRARKEAFDELTQLKNNPLFMFGLALYWGEGDKVTKYQLRLTNSDTEVVRSFKIFLDNFCNGKKEKIWAELLIYQDLNSDICINHWSKAIGLEKKHFTKSIVIKGRHQKNRLSHGICVLGISSRFLKEKMLEWLRLIPKYIIK